MFRYRELLRHIKLRHGWYFEEWIKPKGSPKAIKKEKKKKKQQVRA